MRRAAAATLLLLVAAACGAEEGPAPPPTTTPPSTTAPPDEDDCAVLARRVTTGAARDPQPDGDLHARLSRCFQEALAAEDVPALARAWPALVAGWDGRLRREDGRMLPAAAVAGALVETALDVAGRAAARIPPDDEAAEAALALAEAALGAADDPALARRVAGTAAFADLDRWEDLPGVGPAPSGPRVVVWLDPFHLGEPVLPAVLARWAEAGRLGGLRVVLVPIERGFVRQGLRRVPATPTAERAAMEAAAAERGLEIAARSLAAEEAARALGVGPQGGAIVVLDGAGRVRARRLGGVAMDPRPLEGVVQRVAGR